MLSCERDAPMTATDRGRKRASSVILQPTPCEVRAARYRGASISSLQSCARTLRIARTFCVGAHGQQTVSSSPNETVPVVVPGVHVRPTIDGVYLIEPSVPGPPVAAQPPSTPTVPTSVPQPSSE